MKRLSITILAICVFCSCSHGVIFSITYIEPKKSFVLGDNNHQKYRVTVKNISLDYLKLYQMSKDRIKQPEQVLNNNKTLIILVDANNTLLIENGSERKATVALNINKNVNLTMGYK